MRPEPESSVPRERLTAFTPLPPERNGIADYAAMLLGALSGHYDCEAACADWLAEAPPGVALVDPALAHRGVADDGRVLHQLGNNPGHGFVLEALRHRPGVTTLHDPGLLHLRQTTGATREALSNGLRDAPPAFARYARHVAADGRWSRADHLLFDMAGDVLARSRAVAVHSRFARNRLRALHGEAASAHVEVIPHLLPPFAVPPREEARARLGVPPDAFLVCTAGFATAAKRFDWLIEALETIPAAHWVHAGAERPEEFPLSAAIGDRPTLRGRARVAGYLSEAALADHVAAAFIRLWREGRPAPEELTVLQDRAPAAPRERPPFGEAVWFSLSVGHTGRAEARWLLPKICDGGGITRDAIGAIRVRQDETFVQIALAQAGRFGKTMELEPDLVMRRLDGEPDLDRAPRPAERPDRRKPEGDWKKPLRGDAPEDAPARTKKPRWTAEDRAAKGTKPARAGASFDKPGGFRSGAPKPGAPRDRGAKFAAPRKGGKPRKGDH